MIISICNEKGGSGKTNLVINLAIALAQIHKVLVIDTDPQRSVGVFMQIREQYAKDAQTGFDTISSFEHLKGIDLEKAASYYDFIIIDTGGRDSVEMRYAMIKSDLVIIPTLPNSEFDANVLEKMVELFKQTKSLKEIKANLKAVLVMNNAETNPGLKKKLEQYGEMMQGLADGNIAVADTVIYHREAYSRAISNGLGVAEDPKCQNSPAYSEIMAFKDEILSI